MKNFFIKLGFALIVCLQGVAQNNNLKPLTFLYTNDLHAHIQPQMVGWVSDTRKVGGFANIATKVKQEKSANPNTLYFDAGDFFTGPYVSSLTKGEAVIDIMNTMGIDAACIGNHEFDHGWQSMLSMFNKAKFPILNGNIFNQSTNKLLWNHPYKIFVKNGVKIGVIGLHGKFAFYDTISEEMIQGVEARDEEIYLKKYIKDLKSKVDIVVLLVHQGIPGRQSSKGNTDVARNLKRDIELAKKIPGIDVMITGHAHQGTPEVLESNGTLIVSTDALGMELGKLELVYDTKLDKIVSHKNALDFVYDDAIEDNPQTLAAIQKWEAKLSEISQTHICTCSEPLTRSYGEESYLGNMVSDALMHKFPEYDFAVCNSGGLRQDIPGPDITIGNVISAFPFPNTIVQLELSGNYVKDLFEHAAGQTNGVLQVSKGVEMHYNDTLPAGEKVTLLKIKGEALVPDKQYKILAANFLADGGDGFFAFKKATSKTNTQVEVMQAMVDYLKTFKVYIPKYEGRVVKDNK